MGNVTLTTVAEHLPTYKHEAIFSRDNAAILSLLVRRPDIEGIISTSGASVEIPHITSAAARKKTAGTPVTNDAATEDKSTINLDQHAYTSRIIEKSAEVQSLANLMTSYAAADGRSIAKTQDVDTTILISDASITQNVGVTSSSGVYGDITDAVLRSANQKLDEANAPEEDRLLVISPAQKNALLGIDKFVDASKIGDTDVIRRGLFGEIYGLRVYVSNNLPDVALHTSVSAGDPEVKAHKVCIVMHKAAFGFVEQQAVMTDVDKDLANIGFQVLTDTIYGAGVLEAPLAVQVRTTDES